MTALTNTGARVPRNLVYGYDPEDIVPFIRTLFKNRKFSSIADIGCGNGMHAIAFAEAFPLAEVIATEPDCQFFKSLQSNVSESENSNLTLYEMSLKEFSEQFKLRDFDLVHCSMVLPFTENIIVSLKMISKLISVNGFAVVSLFTYPETYSSDEISVSREYMRRALPKVVNFPSHLEFEKLVSESHMSIVSAVPIPLPYRFRDDELARYKEAVLEKRKKIEDEVRSQFNLSSHGGFISSPVSTFLLQRS